MDLASLFPLLLGVNRYRLIDYDFPAIGGMAAEPLIVLGLVIGSFVIGILFANAVRMRDYGWKIGLILSTFLVSTFLVLFGDFRLGVDLKGGVILVYEVDEKETAELNPQGRSDQWKMGDLIAVIGRRLNPDGLKEIVVRPFGPKQVEIVVPETDPAEIDAIKESISTAGVLQFMIVAGQTDSDLIELAREKAERKEDRLSREVLDAERIRKGYWAKLGREDAEPGSQILPPFRSLDVLQNGIIRDPRTGQIIEIPDQQRNLFAQSNAAFQAFLDERGIREVDVLMVYNPDFELTGNDLGYVNPDRDESLRPSIAFGMRGVGADKMGYLTQENLQRKLAMIFDNALLSAPVIQSRITDRGQITGSFTQQEVDFIVNILRSGSMPVVMQEQPISENQIGSILGLDTIKKGSWSVIAALGAVLAFLALYYRFAGLVACFALVLNLLMTVAIMILLRAPFTLPGLAGLVLTVGMSVDANVLIFERIREELARGATFRMAIRNGFDKAFSAIIDGNMTTLLTAAVLYAIGTDQVRGFGITLILGNLTSMYTAIVVARVIFDVVERTRWIETLSMARLFPTPSIDWVRWFKPATAASIVLIGIGLVATVARGKGLFDIDLAGGTSVTFILKDSPPESEDNPPGAYVRGRLAKVFEGMVDPATDTRVDYNVYEMEVETQQPRTVYKVDSSLSEVDLLQEKVREALRQPDGSDGLKTFAVDIGNIRLVEPDREPPSISSPDSRRPATSGEVQNDSKPAAPEADLPAAKDPAADDAVKKETAADAEDKSADCSQEPVADEDSAKAEPAEDAKAEPAAKADQPEATSEPEAKTEPEAKSEPEPKADPPAETPALPEAATQPGTPPPPAPPSTPVPPPRTTQESTAELTFPGSPLSGDALKDRVRESGRQVLGQDLYVEVYNPNWDPTDNTAYESWTVTLPLAPEQARQVLDHMQTTMEQEVVWQTSSKIGGQVSADTRWKAITALSISVLGIIAYIWFRFQKVAWGLAAIVAIVHDALIMLGAIAVSYWLAPYLGFAGIEEFKISLPVVAAFLTLVGYSVNDTIVIFDRLREIRGKSPTVTRAMLNDAVNQTLARTIITGGLTWMVVAALYVFGGSGIHAFAFSLVIGVIAGAYSTVYIAAPLLLWLLNRQATGAGAAVEKRDLRQPAA